MGFEPELSVVCPPVLSRLFINEGGSVRHIGLGIHRDFCEVAISEAGEVRSLGRIETKPEVLELFARSLDREDEVALEVTGNVVSHGGHWRAGAAPPSRS
jgi:hypothetical protein